MPRNMIWVKRKYTLEKNRPKNLCQIYKIELFHQQTNEFDQRPKSERSLENGNKTIRVDKNSIKSQVQEWEGINERELYGYAVLPESPISCFNHQQEADFCSYESQMNGKFYNWEEADTNENWVQYQY